METVEPYSVEEVTDGRMTWFDEDLIYPVPSLKKYPHSSGYKLSEGSGLDSSISIFLETFAKVLRKFYDAGNSEKEVDSQRIE